MKRTLLTLSLAAMFSSVAMAQYYQPIQMPQDSRTGRSPAPNYPVPQYYTDGRVARMMPMPMPTPMRQPVPQEVYERRHVNIGGFGMIGGAIRGAFGMNQPQVIVVRPEQPVEKVSEEVHTPTQASKPVQVAKPKPKPEVDEETYYPSNEELERDERAEYISMCSSYGYTKAKCARVWDGVDPSEQLVTQRKKKDARTNKKPDDQHIQQIPEYFSPPDQDGGSEAESVQQTGPIKAPHATGTSADSIVSQPLLQVDNPEYVARRAEALKKPDAFVQHITIR